jgi:hypothetical protein
MYFTDCKIRKRFLPKLALLLVVAMGTAFLVPARPEASGYALTEAQVKAAFVFNFLKFIRWPADIQNSDELRVCLLGESEVTLVFKTFEGNKIGSRILKICASDPFKTPVQCHALFVPHGALLKRDINQLLANLINKPVLTISDAPGFTGDNGIIQLIKQGKKIRFNINLASAKAGGLEVSSKLLKLAREVVE